MGERNSKIMSSHRTKINYEDEWPVQRYSKLWSKKSLVRKCIGKMYYRPNFFIFVTAYMYLWYKKPVCIPQIVLFIKELTIRIVLPSICSEIWSDVKVKVIYSLDLLSLGNTIAAGSVNSIRIEPAITNVRMYPTNYK